MFAPIRPSPIIPICMVTPRGERRVYAPIGRFRSRNRLTASAQQRRTGPAIGENRAEDHHADNNHAFCRPPELAEGLNSAKIWRRPLPADASGIPQEIFANKSVRDSFDLCAQLRQLLLDRLVPAIDVINALHIGAPL